MHPGVAIDLGTVNTLVYAARRGLVLDEPSVVAVERPSQKMLGVGRSADALCGRSPENVEIIRPLRDGVISDLDACSLMFSGFLRRVFSHYRFGRPSALVCVPGGATGVERWALVKAADSGNPRFQAALVDETVAAALGTGVDPEEGRAVLVVDIGGGTTEIGVTAGGRKVRSRSIRVAGNAMDAAIVQAVRNKHGLTISDRTAERLKTAVGLRASADPIGVSGVDSARWGWFRTEEVGPALVAGALERPINAIVRALTDLLAEVPADVVDELLDGGVQLAGGGALLEGLTERISDQTCCHAVVVPDPSRCVIRGMASMLSLVAEPGWAA